MKLSDDLFEGIRATLGVSEATTWEARLGRDSARAGAAFTPECAPRVEIEPFGHAGTLRRLVALMDVSKRGVSIVDDRTWAAGEKFVIHLPRTPENIIPLLCQVRNGRMSGTNFRIGAEFVGDTELGREHLRRGTGGVSSGPSQPFIPMTQTGRQAPRRWFGKTAPAQLHTYQQETPGPIMEAEVADLSDTGVGLISVSQLPVGQTIMVRLCPPGGKTMTRMCVVANCRLLDSGHYRIGTTFVQSPKLKGGLQVLLGWFREKK
jgi:hypothetical protein